MTTTAIVQARLGSTRLPGKVLKLLGGRPLFQWVIEQTKESECLDDVVWAIPSNPGDDALASALQDAEQNVVRGSESDVLARFALVADRYPADAYVRLTADNPLMTSDVIDDAVTQFLKEDCDYLSTLYPVPRLFAGFCAEVFTRSALVTADRLASDALDREHVTRFIWSQPNIFRLGSFQSVVAAEHQTIRLTVDTEEDLEVAELFSSSPRPRDVQSAIRLYLDLSPEIRSIRGAC